MWFKRKNAVFEQRGDRLPKILPSQCLGEKCVNYSGVRCAAYEDLLQADGESGRENLPPLQEDATFAIYGKVCLGGEKEQLVAIRAEPLKPGVNIMELMARGGMYGLPLSIESQGQRAVVETSASSEDA